MIFGYSFLWWSQNVPLASSRFRGTIDVHCEAFFFLLFVIVVAGRVVLSSDPAASHSRLVPQEAPVGVCIVRIHRRKEPFALYLLFVFDFLWQDACSFVAALVQDFDR